MLPVTAEERRNRSWGVDRIRRNGWTEEAFEEWIDGKRVLDAGCGMGWFVEYLSERNPNGDVYGIDIAEPAIATGRRHGATGLIVGSIDRPPFPDESFDYVACEEVIHHTPDPAASLRELVEILKPGGTFTMYLYKQKPLVRETADKIIREKTTEMTVEECLEFSEKMAKMGQAFYELDETIEVPEVPTLGIEGGTYDLHEFVYRHLLHCYFDWTMEDLDWSIANTFDW
jgi:ubiquinone/menaquinone biosynthesis C-methylase UbiE